MRSGDAIQILNLRTGEVVEVRSAREILATLDANGTKDALPFMPEMFQYCGQRFRVFKRADKTCDTIRRPVSLRMKNAVHLEGVRCDGTSHGGCQAGCLIFWKEAWLKRVGTRRWWTSRLYSRARLRASDPCEPQMASVCTEDTVERATRRQGEGDGEVFSCQATELPKATTSLAWWDVRQYIRDVTSGNTSAVELARVLSIAFRNMVMRAARRWVFTIGHRVVHRPFLGAPAVGIQSSNAGPSVCIPERPMLGHIKQILDNTLTEHPRIRGKLRKTPTTVLGLQPGELVRVKSKEEILETLDINSRNRGLLFDVEMVAYCGGTYRVLRRVEKILNEKTGRMMTLPNACLILEGVVCPGCLSRNRLFCPRSIYPYWHEVWLERVEASSYSNVGSFPGDSTRRGQVALGLRP